MSKRSETTIGFKSNMYFEPQTVACRCTEEEYCESKSSGNMMIKREWEVAKQGEIKSNGIDVDLIGNTIMQYLVCKNKGSNGAFDPALSRKAQGRVFEDYQKLELKDSNGNVCIGNRDEEIDFDNPPLQAKGLVVDIKIRCKEFDMTHPLTEDEAKAGKKVGEPKLDEHGKQMKGYKLEFGWIEGLHKGEVNPN